MTTAALEEIPLLVLAGGFGTRLQSVLHETPKALAPVLGKPFLSFQIEHWFKQGVNSFVFLLHHHADAIVGFLKNEQNGLLKNCNVRYVIEPTPMGTGGAIAYAIKDLGLEGNFLLTNADTWLGSGIKEVKMASAPAMLVVKVEDVGRYGEVVFDDGHKVKAFVEKRVNPSVGWINAGMTLMNTGIFNGWNGRPFSLEAATYPQLVMNRSLSAVTIQTDFIDIGIPEEYARFCRWLESGKRVAL
jgi:D-glycero-alpha-D-manno-heptose 1-phosphate guanylyltransferase